MVAGRMSIYWISAIIMLVSFGLMMIYFIVFGDTFKTVVMALSAAITHTNFLGQRGCYVILIWIILLPLALKKELQELKIISYILFISLFGFILVTMV